jgi:hypothetical protein
LVKNKYQDSIQKTRATLTGTMKMILASRRRDKNAEERLSAEIELFLDNLSAEGVPMTKENAMFFVRQFLTAHEPEEGFKSFIGEDFPD